MKLTVDRNKLRKLFQDRLDTFLTQKFEPLPDIVDIIADIIESENIFEDNQREEYLDELVYVEKLKQELRAVNQQEQAVDDE